MKESKVKEIETSGDSEDEYVESRVGKVPLQWYNKEEHLGYTAEGQKVKKLQEKSQIEKLLEAQENPQFWKTITDELNQKVHVLTKEQIELVRKIRNRAYINDTIKEGNYQVEIPKDPFPMNNFPLKKQRFMPSKFERLKINKIVYAMKMGWIKPKVPKQKKDPIEEFFKDVHDSWTYKPNQGVQLPKLPAPRQRLPGHDQSFNPAPEFFDEDIEPQKNLRNLESSEQLVKDRFNRLMNLYLAPRVKKKRIHMKEDDFLQELPDLKELKPFPQKCIYSISTNLGLIISMDFWPGDNYLVVADQFCNVEIYHTLTSRKIISFKVESENILKVKFTQNGLLAIICEEFVSFYAVKLNKKMFDHNLDRFRQIFDNSQQQKSQFVNYEFPFYENPHKTRQYICEVMKIKLTERVIQGDLHVKEQFLLLVTAKKDDSRNIHIFNLSKLTNTKIKVKAKSKIQDCIFHNKKSYIIIMTLAHIFLFDLKTQSLKKKLVSGCRRLSSFNIHKSGEHILVGSYDKKLLWFDLDSTQYPFKKISLHDLAIRCLDQSKKFDLFCSGSDDGKIIIQHSKIDYEGFQMPVISPLKFLSGFKKNKQGLSVFQVKFFETSYWLCAAGSHGDIKFYA